MASEHRERYAQLAIALSCFLKTKLLVFGCGSDGNLEYAYRNLNAIADELRLSGADGISGLAFSVYYLRPPIEGLINQKRNLWTFRFLRERGIDAFPAGIVLVGIDFQDASDILRRSPGDDLDHVTDPRGV